MQPEPERAGALALARAQTDELFTIVRGDSLYERPIPERHRIIFYLGHLEAFDWNLIARDTLGRGSFHPAFDQLFAFGIDPDSSGLPQDGPGDWPAVEEVLAYNREVRARLEPLLPQAPAERIHVALEHRLMHAETFAYMLHQLPYGRKRAPEGTAPAASGPPPAARMQEIPAGTAVLGRRREEGFGWDNEFEAHAVEVPAFAIGKHKVTNGDYLEFVRAGAAAPHFWRERPGGWVYAGMFQEIPLPLDWPVYVTEREAEAYARWKGKSLPTEPQFHRAAYVGPPEAGGNFDFRHWDPVPVSGAAENRYGVTQMVGNGWEWTSTVFHPFPGFQPFAFYPGYSANFFDGEHYVLKGGSARTAACLLRASFRNWFRPWYPYVYATFRLVEN
ncbi:MAG TPA: SUMF1/EgtB/PvdO family nonheme iron enzyme [Bryobacteraceae bacterium]|nr:SUMF1/EgtB/PvdO family nonheme iron enzyme [Bryobacteraceae bacterium]